MTTLRWQLVPYVAVLAWASLAALAGVRAVLARPLDPMAEQEAEFRAFAPYLPERGAIGYLEPDADDEVDFVRLYYTAQYSLVPRVIEPRARGEFVIVPRGTVRPDADVRLRGYVRAALLPGGHALYRRFP